MCLLLSCRNIYQRIVFILCVYYFVKTLQARTQSRLCFGQNMPCDKGVKGKLEAVTLDCFLEMQYSVTIKDVVYALTKNKYIRKTTNQTV